MKTQRILTCLSSQRCHGVQCYFEIHAQASDNIEIMARDLPCVKAFCPQQGQLSSLLLGKASLLQLHNILKLSHPLHPIPSLRKIKRGITQQKITCLACLGSPIFKLQVSPVSKRFSKQVLGSIHTLNSYNSYSYTEITVIIRRL